MELARCACFRALRRNWGRIPADAVDLPRWWAKRSLRNIPSVNVLLPLLIVAITPDAPPIEARYPEAVTVFHCTFDASWDKNFDQWPDAWTRRRGRGFPHYVRIKINPQPSPQGDRCLRIELDGGGAVAYSPPIQVDPLFGYVLEGYLKTEGLNHDRAYFSVTLLDEQRQRLETFYSRKVRQTPGWQKLRLGPIAPGSGDARLASSRSRGRISRGRPRSTTSGSGGCPDWP